MSCCANSLECWVDMHCTVCRGLASVCSALAVWTSQSTDDLCLPRRALLDLRTNKHPIAFRAQLGTAVREMACLEVLGAGAITDLQESKPAGCCLPS